MTRFLAFHKPSGFPFRIVVLLLLFACSLWAQPPGRRVSSLFSLERLSIRPNKLSDSTNGVGASVLPRPGQSTSATQSGSPPKQDPKPPGSAATASDREQKISPTEAKELFQSVDQILRFASKDSLLPIKHPVKTKLTSRDEVVSYLEKSMREDKSAQRVYRSELVLKKFGLLPRDFHLQDAVVAMLREQVAGYYDPKSKTMNLLDWVPVDQQKPVLAHELTHALQDQSFGLEKWMKKGDVDLDKKKQLSSADLEADEADEAREAVVEGQAEAVMVNYILAPLGRTVMNSPETIAALDADMIEGTADSVEFKNAPIFLKESLTFPYRYGIKFVAALMKAGQNHSFAASFQNVPRTTRQIMEPNTYLSGERIDPLPLPDLKNIFKNYERFDVGAIGEFDVSMLIEQYADVGVSNRMYPAWRGGYYYSVRPKSNPAAPLGLLYVSRWSDAEQAAQFGAIYARALAKRYRKVQAVLGEEEENPTRDSKGIDRLSGVHTWQTEEGPVVIDVQGDTVLVSESLEEEITARLEQDVFQTTAGK
jgi:hypothetical protein